MQLFIFVATFFVLSSSAVATSGVDVFCEDLECNEGETCYAVESCTPADSNTCAVEAMCLSPDPGFLGCWIGKPLLKPNGSNEFVLRSCWEEYDCPHDFFCNTVLAGAPSRCCQSSSVDGTKSGTCPQQDSSIGNNDCVKKCLVDADCPGNKKCCPQSDDCEKKHCISPA